MQDSTPADEVLAEGEDVAEREPELVTRRHLPLALADAHDCVALVHLAINDQRRVLLELGVEKRSWPCR